MNLLAAPALEFSGITHVAAVVAGTGTVGRTIRIDQSVLGEKTGGSTTHSQIRELPLEDIGVARGWGYV